jgi:hypothetical protein
MHAQHCAGRTAAWRSAPQECHGTAPFVHQHARENFSYTGNWSRHIQGARTSHFVLCLIVQSAQRTRWGTHDPISAAASMGDIIHLLAPLCSSRITSLQSFSQNDIQGTTEPSPAGRRPATADACGGRGLVLWSRSPVAEIGSTKSYLLTCTQDNSMNKWSQSHCCSYGKE